ncbi:MAG TPA: PQQ-binding-like beta-propeller repeat protein, partial [Steroidobacteraceae bacterium]
MRTWLIGGCLSALLVVSHSPAQNSSGTSNGSDPASHPGREVYERYCGGCHNNPEATRAPSLASLQTMNRSTVEYAITIGYMRIQAKALNATERTQLLDWLSIGQTDQTAWIEQAKCKGNAARIDPSAKPIAATFGLGHRNLRQLSAEQAGLRKEDFAKLELAWAFGLPQTPTMRSQPVVAGDTIFVASTDAGRLFALSAQTGCVKWHFEAPAPLRS